MSVSFLKATLSQCHFPLWGDEPTPLAKKRVCGEPVRAEGESYCEECHRRSRARGTARDVRVPSYVDRSVQRRAKATDDPAELEFVA